MHSVTYAVADSNIMHIIRIKYIFPLYLIRKRNLVCHMKRRVFGNRVMMREIFGPKVGHMTGQWRQLHIEQLYQFYWSTKIFRMIEWGWNGQFKWLVSGCEQTHTYIHTYTHTHIHTYTHTYMHTYIHTYIHTRIHTYIHIYRGMAGTYNNSEVLSEGRGQ